MKVVVFYCLIGSSSCTVTHVHDDLMSSLVFLCISSPVTEGVCQFPTAAMQHKYSIFINIYYIHSKSSALLDF